MMENATVVARVTVRLASGREEVWGIPLRLAPNGPYFRSWAFLPEGATVIEQTAEILPFATAHEIKIDYRELPVDWRQTTTLPDSDKLP